MKLHSYLYCCIWLLLASFSSCSKAGDSSEELLPPITIPDEMLTITSPYELGNSIITFVATTSWEVEASYDWLEVSSMSGKAGNITLTIKIEANTVAADRLAIISIKAGGKIYKINVTQKAAPVMFSIDPSSSVVTSEAGTLEVGIISNSDWSANNSSDWVKLSANSGKVGNQTITASYLVNDGSEPRRVVITFTSGTLSQTLTITQEGKVVDPTLSIDKTSANVDAASGSFTLNVSSNSDWSTSGIPAWVTLSPMQGKGNQTVIVNYLANDGSEPRSVVITFTSGTQSQTLTIAQEGKPIEPTLSIDKTSANVEAASGSFTLNVSSNSDWSTSGIPAWVILSLEQGKGNRAVTVSYQANSSTESRSATVTFSVGNIRKTLTITQAGMVEDKIELSRYAMSAGASSAQAQLSVTTNTAWQVSNVPSWMTVSPGNGTQSGTVTIGWEANLNAAERSATLRFTAGTSYKELVVTQAGQYILTMETTVLQFKSDKSSQTITFYANGAWSIADDQEWLSLSASSGYAGNQQVTVYAAQHQGNAARNGTITVTVGTGANQVSKQVKVTQTLQPTLSVASTQLKAPFQTSSYNVALTSNTTWSAASNQTWCTVSPTSGSGNGSVKLSVERNTLSEQRVAVVTLKAGSAAAGYVSKTITITQNANNDFSINDWGDNGDHGGSAQ